MDDYKCDVCEVVFDVNDQPPVLLLSVTNRKRYLCPACYDEELYEEVDHYFDEDYIVDKPEKL